MHRRRIHKRNFAHTDDSYRIFLAGYMTHDIIEAVGDTEEIRTVNLIYLYAFRNGEVLKVQIAFCIFVRVYLIMESADLGLFVGSH